MFDYVHVHDYASTYEETKENVYHFLQRNYGYECLTSILTQCILKSFERTNNTN